MNLSTIKKAKAEYDYVIIGSGFGGSISALRLTEKGYKVLVIEKGRQYSSSDFPKSNWKIRRWLWIPSFRFFGFFKMTFFRHVGVLSGVGVGGGSLVYANTLPRPASEFFKSGSWAGLADWEKELAPFYNIAEKMLGAAVNPRLFDPDLTLQKLATKIGREKFFEPTLVSVFFGEPEKSVQDPYFGGEGPDREGCSFCGGCMTGCRHNAKNTLDRNYLWLAAKKGAEILPEHIVRSIRPSGAADGSDGYEISFKRKTSFLFSRRKTVRSSGVVVAGGVLGTVRLLLDMKRKHLPLLSNNVGNFIRTNNESLILVDSRDYSKDFSKGVAIGAIFPPDENSHIETVRYSSGSGFWKLLCVPLTHGRNVLSRTGKLLYHLLRHPYSWLHVYFTLDHAKQSVILLYMQHLNSTLNLRRGLFSLRTEVSSGEAPTAFMPESKKLAEQVSEIISGKPFVMITEAISGMPTTAHVLGGCVIGSSAEDGVIDTYHRAFGYQNLYVCDGSAISANPGVNPSLSISAMTERAMASVPVKY
ncbi:MAG: GMC oxidoreductase [Bacteroidales bacterium]|jgi:cholesterol oxidase